MAETEHVREFKAFINYDITVMNQSTFPSPEVHEKKRQVRFFITELLKVAAIVLLVLGIQQIIDYRQHNSSLLTYQTLYVPAGQRAELLSIARMYGSMPIPGWSIPWRSTAIYVPWN